jgi:hypothetical protein
MITPHCFKYEKVVEWMLEDKRIMTELSKKLRGYNEKTIQNEKRKQ